MLSINKNVIAFFPLRSVALASAVSSATVVLSVNLRKPVNVLDEEKVTVD